MVAVPKSKPFLRGSKKKKSRKNLVKELDRVFSIWIRNRDGNRCIQCGSRERLTNGHLFSRVNYSTRWDEDNCFCQCMSDNYRHEMEFEPFRRIVEARIGKERYDALWQRHNQIRKFKDYEIQELINKYKE